MAPGPGLLSATKGGGKSQTQLRWVSRVQSPRGLIATPKNKHPGATLATWSGLAGLIKGPPRYFVQVFCHHTAAGDVRRLANIEIAIGGGGGGSIIPASNAGLQELCAPIYPCA